MPHLAVGGRVLRKGSGLQACGSTGCRLNQEEILAPAATDCTPCAPDIPRHSPGRSRAGCSDTECGPGRSRPHRSRPGRSAEPWLCREPRRARPHGQCKERTARTQRHRTVHNTSEGTGQGGAASSQGGGAAAFGAYRARSTAPRHTPLRPSRDGPALYPPRRLSPFTWQTRQLAPAPGIP